MASKDQTIGAAILIACVLGILIYGYLLVTPWWDLVLKLTGFVAVGGVLAIGAWIGYTMATTPPPKPIEELEEEIKAEKPEEKEAAAQPEAEEKKEAPAEQKT